MNNFDFLEKLDLNLFEIIKDAEKLYTAEFFDQCISQTRRFGEQMCKIIFENRRQFDGSFDEMLATLKDEAKTIPEKEFIDDLYFLKKQGNISVHSSSVKRDGITALECLQRAFEASINFAVFYKKCDKKILKKHYDINLLMTGKPDLKTKYQTQKQKIKSNSTKKIKQSYTMKPSPQNRNNISIFWIFICISSFISLILLIFINFLA